MKKILGLLMIPYLGFVLSACGGGGGVSTLPTSDAFDESDLDFNPKMDILWVVDPSRSMYEEVELVRNNIQAFVTDFINDGYEYQMGVISTAAWSHEEYLANNSLSYLLDDGEPVFARLHRGECVDAAGADSTNPIMDSFTEGAIGPFMLKFQKLFDMYGVALGTSGCGLVGPPFKTSYEAVPGNIFGQAHYDDATRGLIARYIDEERPLQSIRAFLNEDALKPENDRFVREDAYLAIIVITDEPDSSDGTAQSYVDFIRDNIKDGAANKFAIYSIVDPSIADHKTSEAAQASGGISFNINGDQQEYIDNLSQIKEAILVNATAYPLEYEPIVSTIEIEILRANGVVDVVPQSQGGSEGWSYDEATNSISFSPNYIPTREDAIVVNYTPRYLVPGVSNLPRLDLSAAEVEENSADGTVIGVVSLRNADATGGVYSISTDTSSGGFAIDGATGEITIANTNLLDADTKAREQLNVSLTLPDSTEYDRDFIIRIIDVADNSPVANDDEFIVSASTADSAGDLFVTGNITYNDTGLDASEAHSFALEGTAPAEGTLVVQANGVFTYNVNVGDLTFPGSGELEITFDYRVTGSQPATDTDTATVTITVLKENQSPIVTNDIADQDIDVSLTPETLQFDESDVTVSGIDSGSIADLVNPGSGSGLVTTTSPSPWIELAFPSGKEFFEVQQFILEGGHSLGNTILQVIAADGRVLTREVVGVDDGVGNLTIDMDRAVIGRRIRILRPLGSVNPNGDQELNVHNITVHGVEAHVIAIDLNAHFDDPDFGDTLTFYITDEYGEGAGPGWATVVDDGDGTYTLRLMPPVGAEATIGVLAQDDFGATAFQTFDVTREGSGDFTNAAPISLLALDDAKRGGVTLKRFGGGTENGSNPQSDNAIRHGEGDNFLVNPYAGQDLRDALTGQSPSQLSNTGYRCTAPYNCIPAAIRNALIADGHEDQLAHFGDNYGAENGWDITPVHEDPKFPLGSFSYCVGDPSTTPPSPPLQPNGRIIPCINTTRSYGETYTAFFVPAKTGVYRFRSPIPVDDTARLLLAPTEYVEDLKPVFTTHHTGVQSLMNSLYDVTGDSYVANGEFSPNAHPAGGHDTSIFFDNDPGAESYKKGYVRLEQGNVYAFEIRFQEGGGTVLFEFEYDRKDQGTNDWDGWKAIDASVMVPTEGVDGHTPLVIEQSNFPFDAKALFYDAEDDALVYTARLVNPDGTSFGDGNIGQIGLNLGSQNGMLSGALNATYTSLPEAQRPRIIFKAKERFTDAKAEVESLPIKLND